MSLSRSTRQIIVAAVFFSILTLLLLGVYFAFIKSPATCFDNKKNQNEQGIDCGGICSAVCKEVIVAEDLQFQEVVFVPGGNNRFDVLAKVYNANDQIGASSFRYTFELKDASGAVLQTYSGKSYILPQETKNIIAIGLETEGEPASVGFLVDSVEWERFSGYQEKPAVNIYQKRYNELTTGVGFGEVFGLLSNESPYDFQTIIVKVILRDKSGKALAFNTTTMNTVRSSEERDFRLIWPTPFPGVVERVDMEVDADFYHAENFIKQYFPGGEFQDLTPSRSGF